jgi:hypothetical protein
MAARWPSGYAIPADNPFVGVPGVREEVWAFGLRNPYRFSFDRQAGDLWIGDVGQGSREEVDFEPAGDPGGRNWGWDVMEGTLCNSNDPAPSPPCNDASLTRPRYQYAHTVGRCSITGGYVYRGTALPEVAGLYFFGDFCTGEIWTLDPSSEALVDRTADLSPAAGATFQLVGFGEDGAGELLVVQMGAGTVYRVLPSTPCSDGLDNDRDGFVDYPDDPGCRDASSVREDPRCQDGIDNDLATGIDFDGGASVNGGVPLDVADPDCTTAWKNREGSGSCGLGAELVLALAALGPLGARAARRRARGIATSRS